MIRLKKSTIEDRAKKMPAGYLDDVLSFCVSDGEYLKIRPADYVYLANKYRNDQSQPVAPSLSELADNFTTAVKNWSASGFATRTKEDYDRISTICSGCEHWDEEGYVVTGKCNKCGCTNLKRWLATEKCPIGKW